MGRKVALTATAVMVVVLSVVLVGGQVGGGGFLWWGNREPIYIYGDDDFTIRNGVMSGAGTADDPYIIEGWRIDSPSADYGIYIDHTTAHFVIRDCVIERARLAGIYFNTVRNGCVESTQIGLADTAVYLLDSTENMLTGNVVAQSKCGVVMGANSRDNWIVGNAFFNNGMNAYDPYRWNCWFEPCRGNYWSDYDGGDRDGDGIGDVAYYHVFDAYPLASPPVEWTRVAPAGIGFAGNRVAPDGSLIVTSETPITLTALDPGSGVAEIHYAIDGGEWLLYSGPIFLSGEDGPRKLTYYGLDYLGNVETKQTVGLFLDNNPPKTVLGVGEPQHIDERGMWISSSTPITLQLVHGSTYGETEIFYDLDGRGWHRYAGPFSISGPDGPHQISFYGYNASGVTEAMKSTVLYKDDAAPSTRGGQTSAGIDVQIGGTIEPAEPAPPPEVPAPVVEEAEPQPVPPSEADEDPAAVEDSEGDALGTEEAADSIPEPEQTESASGDADMEPEPEGEMSADNDEETGETTTEPETEADPST